MARPRFDREAMARLRTARGLSQEGLARTAGIASVTVSKLEQGRITDPRLGTVLAVATALGCSVEDLSTAVPG